MNPFVSAIGTAGCPQLQPPAISKISGNRIIFCLLF